MIDPNYDKNNEKDYEEYWEETPTIRELLKQYIQDYIHQIKNIFFKLRYRLRNEESKRKYNQETRLKVLNTLNNEAKYFKALPKRPFGHKEESA
ncbi:MAG: hypothetical protein WC365_10260 [Candidatus Babeliales bacterium]|jgi:sulfite reductase alpha subunit-like flavoprotein